MSPTRPNRRRGVTLFETVVSFTLLIALLGVVTPLVARHNRLLADERAYRLVVDGLSNELERLTTLSGDPLAQAVAALPPDAIAGVTLRGRVDPADACERITLTAEWPERRRGMPPLTLTGWSVAATPENGGAP